MNNISQSFGDEVPILIGIEREYSTILDAEFLHKVKDLQKELLQVELVKNIVSIVNTTHIESMEDGFSAFPIIPEDFTGTKDELLQIKKKVRDWTIYERSIVSDDLKALQMIVFLNVKNEESGTEQAMTTCKKIMQMVDDWHFRDSKTYITGMPVFSEVVNEATGHDLSVLIPLVILVVVLVLLISFRRFSGVALPLLTVIVSTIWAIGAMGLFGVPLSILSTVLPVILIAVGSAYGIHVINIYYDDARRESVHSKGAHKILVIKAVGGVIRPVSLAALTTFAGFFSFCFTSVAPIFEFGLFSSLGILFAFLISITLIPALLIIRGPKKIAPKKKLVLEGIDFSKIDVFLAKTLVVISEHKRSVAIFAFFAVVVSILGIRKLEIDNIFMEYFQDDVAVVKSDSFIRDKFGGSKLLNIVISSQKEGRVVSSEVLKACDELSLYLTKEIKDVGKVTSVVDLVKRMNQVMNANKDADAKHFAESSKESLQNSDKNIAYLQDQKAENNQEETEDMDAFGFPDFEEGDTDENIEDENNLIKDDEEKSNSVDKNIENESNIKKIYSS